MPTQELPLPFFVGGAPALDFLNSIASPVDVPVEWLSSGENFLNWLSQANLVKPEVLQLMADLVTTVDFTHVKGCERHTCTLLFVDTTRGRMRRWCSMAVCGNRAKQAAHRGRSPRGSKAKESLERR